MYFTPEPKRPFRSLEVFRLYSYGVRAWHKPARVSDDWPCLGCEGRGWFYHDDDRDPIEGFKLAPRRKCIACNGTRKGSKEAVKAAYEAIIARWRKEVEAWHEGQALRKSGLAKLTKDEKRALGL